MENPNELAPPKKSSLLNIFIKVVLPLVLGIYIVYYLIHKIDPDALWAVLKSANWGILLFSLIFGLLGNTIRAYRWELLIKPLGYSPKFSNLCFAIYGGYAVNLAIPRAGEIWKCGMVSKVEKIPFTKLFGTMILDRIFDMFTVLLISVVAIVTNMQFFVSQLEKNQSTFDFVMKVLKSPIFYIAIIAVIAIIYIVFKYFKENIIVVKIKKFIAGMVYDMKTIWHMKTKGRLLIATIAIWGSYFLYFYITFFAFDFTKDLGITAGLVTFSLSSLSMIIPSNGGLGPWQIAVIGGLMLYGVSELNATAFATGVFALQSIIWTTVCGLFGIIALAVKNRNNK